ncbi:hypothetical protein COS59_00970 [Candidatus Wolfebacteria bacterium CG03_land_8_20_14_0_80_36_15]|uniref:Uncharacterized protein n=1 Tax=Candidatus Wolfebacteria bacterium CG03_land_8_20_14_0_80_36_15 TaxID=1975067 RepID=A0A2M7B805_9BACT|nr:MAG: hypothetical protein COS59_00970 [Candidatus Wolfebacteria bacterium CG03_land_8_20_14_0_80_36_15]
MPRQKKPLFFLLLIILIIGLLSLYFYLQKQAKNKESEQIKIFLADINEGINLMDSAKDEMPRELLEVHQFLIDKGQKNEIKFAQIPSELKDFILFHGAKYQILYVDPTTRLKSQIWIPLLYHEAGHLYWHSKHPVETLEEFQGQLYASEEHSYTIDAQAWNIVKKHFPIIKENLTSQELKLFNLYERETSLYNKMIEGDFEAKTEWIKIIEADIKEQEKYQEVLLEKQ